MDLTLLILRILLAFVFGLAAVAKVLDLDGSAGAMSGFGVPKKYSKLFSTALIVIEIAIAVGLLVPGWSVDAAIAAFVLITIFTVVMAYHYAQGNTQDCHCFGQLVKEPVGAASLTRNAGLMILSAILISRGTLGQGTELSDITRPDAAVILAACSLGVLVFALSYLRRIYRMQERIAERLDELELTASQTVDRDAGDPADGLPIGATAPLFALPDTDGGFSNLEMLLGRSRPVLLFFVSPGCAPCRAMTDEFDAWESDLGERFTFAFVSSGDPLQNVAKFGGNDARPILLQKDREVAEAYFARWTPSLVLVGADGRIASHVAAGDAAIRGLIAAVEKADLSQPYVHFAVGTSSRETNKIGEPIPDITETTVSGKPILSADIRGKRTLIAFWGEDCSHCEALRPRLTEWYRTRTVSDPELVIFSDAASTDADFPGRVIADGDYTSARLLGMHGTPSAILIDEHGTIASETAIGSEAIWALLGRYHVEQ